MAELAACLTIQAADYGAQIAESVDEKKLVEGHELALRAKELDPDKFNVYVAMLTYAYARGDLAGEHRAAETMLSLEPKNPIAYIDAASVFLTELEPRRAIELVTQAISLNPKHPHEALLRDMGVAYFMLGDNDTAIDWLLKATEKNPAGDPYTFLAMAYALNGEDAKARAAVADARRLDPNDTLSEQRKDASRSSAAYKEWFESKFVPAWRKAGLPE